MDRYFIEISFRGTAYHGWQKQPNAITVQQVLENALHTLLREPVETTGAGRTDTGVHARRFAAHFDSAHPVLGDPGQLVYHLNRILPEDVAVQDLYRVNPEVHARFTALNRTYVYRISRTKDPFDPLFAWYYPHALNLAAMRKAAEILPLHHDFSSFSKLHTQVKTQVCRIDLAEWTEEGDKLIFRIRADRFLRNMVRAIVGTLIDIGRGQDDPECLHAILGGKDRRLAGFSAPACGLTLWDITYPDNIRTL
jgi:tRNA pseudouridine38-40 synthase